jgi:hypothetical protein
VTRHDDRIGWSPHHSPRAAVRGPVRVAGMLGTMFLIVLGLGASATASAGTPATGWSGPSIDNAAPTPRHADALGPNNCSNMATITSCVLNILAPGGGTQGVYLQKVGGPVLANSNETFAYEPASSIKPVIALYAMEQVANGVARLTDEVPMIDGSGGPGDCPPSTITGTEPLGGAIQQMLQVSDNNRTRELMQYFGVNNLNAFAASLGLSNTMFQTSGSPPGFNVIGCISYGFSSTVDGNTMSLTDASKLWSAIASLPAPYSDAFYQMAAGRDMFNTQGYDFTGWWPIVTAIANQEIPAGLSSGQINAFESHLNVSVKGGNYFVENCCQEATWWVFAGVAQIPSCVGATMTQTSYTWGYFIHDAVEPQASSPNQTVAGKAFFRASGQLLSAPIAQALATWSQCTPVKHKKAKLHVSGTNISSGVNVDIGATLATVSDTDPADIAPDLQGTISWGDGTTSFATLSGGSGKFTVHGWHTYPSPRKYKVKVTVRDMGSGKSAKGHLKIMVS